MDARPRISIIMPSLNHGTYLEEAIQSVLDQDYPAFELIVVDGGSTDESLEIIRRYQDRIAWWGSEPDGGQSEAINKGITHCTGHVINWLNADDLLMPGALESIGRAFQSNPSVGLVTGAHLICDSDGRILRVSSPPSRLGVVSKHMAIPIGQQSAFFSREAICSLRGVRPDLHHTMDTDLLYRFFRERRRYCRIGDFIGVWRHHPDTKRVIGRVEGGSENRRLLAEYGIGRTSRAVGWHRTRIGRIMDGSYGRSFRLSLRYRGMHWKRVATPQLEIMGACRVRTEVTV